MKKHLLIVGMCCLGFLSGLACSSKQDAPVAQAATAESMNNALLDEIEGLIYKQDYANALRKLNTYIDANGTSAYILTLRAIAQAKMGKASPAILDAIEATKIEYSAVTLLNAGNVLQQFGLSERAADAYRQALVLSPDDYQLYNNLASAYFGYGETDLGKSALDKALQLNPNDNVVITNLAVYYILTNDFENARATAQQAISLNSGYGPAYKALQFACTQLKDSNCAQQARNQYSIVMRPKSN